MPMGAIRFMAPLRCPLRRTQGHFCDTRTSSKCRVSNLHLDTVVGGVSVLATVSVLQGWASGVSWPTTGRKQRNGCQRQDNGAEKEKWRASSQDDDDEREQSVDGTVFAPTNRQVEGAIVALLARAQDARQRRDERLDDDAASADYEAARWEARMALRRSSARALREAIESRGLKQAVGGPRGGLQKFTKAQLVARVERAERLV